ncbi:MAG: hypothetical protein AAGM04_00770 [Pseudomonadota bacterium]
MNAKSPDPALALGDVPTLRRVGKPGVAGLEIGSAFAIKSHGRQLVWFPDCGVKKRHAALGAVVENPQLVPCFRIDPVDHPGFKVGHKKLFVHRIKGNVAQRCTGVLSAFQRDGGEHFGLILVAGAQNIYRPRSAFATPKTGHPAVVIKMQTKLRRCGQIDVRLGLVVQRNAEHLPHITGGDGVALRLILPMLPTRRGAWTPQINDGGDRTVQLNQNVIARQGDTGKTGDHPFPTAQRLKSLLRKRDGLAKKQAKPSESGKKHAPNGNFHKPQAVSGSGRCF